MSDPRLPFAIRALNRGGALLGALGARRPRLDEESLCAEARKRTGLDAFGDEGFRAPFRRLLAALEDEAGLTTLGRIIARAEMVNLLSNRLQIADWWQRHPEIGDETVRAPLFIVGMGRTGTTILHELLALDPRNRVPLSWEVQRPCPPPIEAERETDPRVAQTDHDLAQTDRILPEFKKMHPMGARLPQECIAITAHDFTSMLHHTAYHVPSYAHWLHREADLAPVYASHRRFLQLLQWRSPGEHWVLKSPGHLWALEHVLHEYPDAVFIQTHRDPLRIVASLASLIAMLRSMTSRHADLGEIAEEWAEHIAVALDHAVDVRESGRIPEDRILDLQFRDFLAEPIGFVKRIYDRFGMTFTAETESRMRDHLNTNPSDKHGAHFYRFGDTGLDEAALRRRFQRYQEAFDVPVEPLG